MVDTLIIPIGILCKRRIIFKYKDKPYAKEFPLIANFVRYEKHYMGVHFIVHYKFARLKCFDYTDALC